MASYERGRFCFSLIAAMAALFGTEAPGADDVSGPAAGQPWVNSLGVKFVPAGTDGVLFSVWDVRVKDFQAFVDATGYKCTGNPWSVQKGGWQKMGYTWENPGFPQTEDDPVVDVTKSDGDAFAQWLTKKEQGEGTLASNQEYRLPTNAEWDKAVGPELFPWGSQWPPPAGVGNYAGSEAQNDTWPNGRVILDNYTDGYSRTSPVGSFPPNAYGLYDMGGNVWQWCESRTRGGSWASSTRRQMVSSPGLRVPDMSSGDDRGFRIVLVVSSQMNSAPLNAGPQTNSGPSGMIWAHNRKGEMTDLPSAETEAVVLIRGDNREGTGFLVKTADGPAVITTIHVISDNPNLQITTKSGVPIPVLSLKGAADRDLAMIAVKDGSFSYLGLASNVGDNVPTGDEVIISGSSETGEVLLNARGRVLGIGPQRIEIDHPVYRAAAGGPVFHVKSGKVIGVMAEAIQVGVSSRLDKDSFAGRNAATAGPARYFGLRIDNVPRWETYDWARFQTETLFLDQFDQRNRCLDCYLNSPNDDRPEDKLYLEDEMIAKANSEFSDQFAAGDASGQMFAFREWQTALDGIANADVDAMQNPNNFYAFDQQRAKDELAYRRMLKAELDAIDGTDANKVKSLGRPKN
ncbi:MAG TPA: SUMF1/EgtB/PvdO family nonheme iron enzyme [Candidatus Methylacidiphilales bacterium]|nr:SUMF1/EgtB/PvdO family nonheme iron enzyme [Candidatus Methylacidiphilales bacterium]